MDSRNPRLRAALTCFRPIYCLRARCRLDSCRLGGCRRFHSNLTYLPQTVVSPTSELRCAIPPVPEGLAVDLTVTLPRGVAPSGDDSPRLAWTERDYRWIGTASLPTAPAVVRIPESWNPSAFRARLFRWTGIGALCALVGLLIVFIWVRSVRLHPDRGGT